VEMTRRSRHRPHFGMVIALGLLLCSSMTARAQDDQADKKPARRLTVTGQGIFAGPGHVEEPSCRCRYKSVRLDPQHPAGRGVEKKGGERHGKAACASVQPVPVRALRPPLLGGPVWTRPNPIWSVEDS